MRWNLSAGVRKHGHLRRLDLYGLWRSRPALLSRQPLREQPRHLLEGHLRMRPSQGLLPGLSPGSDLLLPRLCLPLQLTRARPYLDYTDVQVVRQR